MSFEIKFPKGKLPTMLELAETPEVRELLKTETIEDFVKLLKKYQGTKIKPYEGVFLDAHGSALATKKCSEEYPTKATFVTCLATKLRKKTVEEIKPLEE